MTLSISNESKATLSITNESKPSNQTFDDMPVSFDSVSTTFAQAGTAIVKESKNTLNITNENKN